jgi:hypothetical protein
VCVSFYTALTGRNPPLIEASLYLTIFNGSFSFTVGVNETFSILSHAAFQGNGFDLIPPKDRE